MQEAKVLVPEDQFCALPPSLACVVSLSPSLCQCWCVFMCVCAFAPLFHGVFVFVCVCVLCCVGGCSVAEVDAKKRCDFSNRTVGVIMLLLLAVCVLLIIVSVIMGRKSGGDVLDEGSGTRRVHPHTHIYI